MNGRLAENANQFALRADQIQVSESTSKRSCCGSSTVTRTIYMGAPGNLHPLDWVVSAVFVCALQPRATHTPTRARLTPCLGSLGARAGCLAWRSATPPTGSPPGQLLVHATQHPSTIPLLFPKGSPLQHLAPHPPTQQTAHPLGAGAVARPTGHKGSHPARRRNETGVVRPVHSCWRSG